MRNHLSSIFAIFLISWGGYFLPVQPWAQSIKAAEKISEKPRQPPRNLIGIDLLSFYSANVKLNYQRILSRSFLLDVEGTFWRRTDLKMGNLFDLFNTDAHFKVGGKSGNLISNRGIRMALGLQYRLPNKKETFEGFYLKPLFIVGKQKMDYEIIEGRQSFGFFAYSNHSKEVRKTEMMVLGGGLNIGYQWIGRIGRWGMTIDVFTGLSKVQAVNSRLDPAAGESNSVREEVQAVGNYIGGLGLIFGARIGIGFG